MHSESAPSLTRFDVVLAFLRAQLWISVVALFVGGITSLSYVWSGFGAGFISLRVIGLALIPVILLILFPSLLAGNALGRTARAPVASFSDLRPLIGRCTGLFLFVQSLGHLVILTGLFLYSSATQPSGSLWRTLFGSAPPGRYMWVSMAQLTIPLLSVLIGFFLAFGPAIRDNFREG